MLKGKKAVIFDLDGTLIDSLGIWSAVDELLATSLGRPDLAADPVTLARLREDALVRHALEPNLMSASARIWPPSAGARFPARRSIASATTSRALFSSPTCASSRARPPS